MKLILKALLAVMFVLMSCNPLWADELPPYVNADWGASPDNVMFWEREPVHMEKSVQKPWQTESVLYVRHMFGRQFSLNYSFDGDKLYAADYFLEADKAQGLSIADVKYMIADIDSKILPQLGTPRTAMVEKGLPVAGENPGVWRYGKMAANERICMLIFAVVDEAAQTASFSVSFADAGHDAAVELKDAFDNIRKDESWSTETAARH